MDADEAAVRGVTTAAFRTRARTVDHLGRGQIADCPTAVSELWKNAWDAYARNVILRSNPPSLRSGPRRARCRASRRSRSSLRSNNEASAMGAAGSIGTVPTGASC